MKDFKGKVAVITGGASGIGFALAQYCVHEGMNVILADVEVSALAEAEHQLKATGAAVLTCRCDVSKAKDIDQLAQTALEAFGGVHLLFNNAGVVVETPIWESTLADWEWVLGVNLWGVVHGIRKFVPIMLEQNTPCHIVNTASLAGLIADSGLGVYKVSKHAVVSLSETLYYELAQTGKDVKVSVLCPGFVKTRLHKADRNRPAELQTDGAPSSGTTDDFRGIAPGIEAGKPPEQIAAAVFDAIRSEQFYILTHRQFDAQVEKRMKSILADTNPPLL